jgi:hypothetical protein
MMGVVVNRRSFLQVAGCTAALPLAASYLSIVAQTGLLPKSDFELRIALLKLEMSALL